MNEVFVEVNVFAWVIQRIELKQNREDSSIVMWFYMIL